MDHVIPYYLLITLRISCWLETSGIPWVKSETSFHTGSAKKDTDHARLVGGRLNNQGNLHRRVGQPQSRFPHPPPRILKVYIEALPGFAHIIRPDGLRSILQSQGCVLENGSHCGNSGQKDHSKDREGPRSSQLPGSRSWVNWRSHPLHDLLR